MQMAFATPSLPSEASEQRFGRGAAAAPLVLLDATLEPSEPPPAVQLQVGATANAMMCVAHLMPICLPCHANLPALSCKRFAAPCALAHRRRSRLLSPSAPRCAAAAAAHAGVRHTLRRTALFFLSLTSDTRTRSCARFGRWMRPPSRPWQTTRARSLRPAPQRPCSR